MRQLSLLDTFLCEVDSALRTLITPTHRSTTRPNPAKSMEEPSLTAQEKKHVAGLMRVNHAGEVSAQALYQGQALTAELTTVKTQMTNAAAEEIDHLAWCEDRLRELKSKPSLLNPLWYSGSLLLGAIAGLAGDKWSLGFVAETEKQVTHHLQEHLKHIPLQDAKTKTILSHMQEDELHHAEMAVQAGAAPLPSWIKKGMRGISKIMTKTSYYI